MNYRIELASRLIAAHYWVAVDRTEDPLTAILDLCDEAVEKMEERGWLAAEAKDETEAP